MVHVEGYDGPERRAMTSEMYITVCKDRFESQNKEISEIRSDTQYLRRKIDNGLSSVPGKLDNLEGQLKKQYKKVTWVSVTVIIAFLAGAGGWLFSYGQMTEKLNSHIADVKQIAEGVKDYGPSSD